MSKEDGALRLQAFLAEAGIASRRACERLIEEGRVRVNGLPATLGMSVRQGDAVEFDGKPVGKREEKRYLALNKPRGFVSTMSDERGRPTAASLLTRAVSERVYNVGRLDQWSSGLLLFTNDGQLAKLLGHPSGSVDKEYLVSTDLDIPPSFEADFEAGIRLEDGVHKALSARRTGPRSLAVVLVEGRNREIRRVLELYGLRALSLSRVRIGPISLDGLAEGSFRELTDEEVAALFRYSGPGSGEGSGEQEARRGRGKR